MKYIVFVRERWIQGYEVEAESKEEAKALIAAGEGDAIEGDFEYDESEDPETWRVIDAPKEKPNETSGKANSRQAQGLPDAKGIASSR